MTPEQKRKAFLEMTAEDHYAIGSTPLEVLAENPGKTLLETMSESELRAYILKQVRDTEEQHALARSGDTIAIRLLPMLVNEYLAPNLAYLRLVGRLPAELSELDPEVKFAL